MMRAGVGRTRSPGLPERIDPRLREFLADEYHRGRRHDEAMA